LAGYDHGVFISTMSLAKRLSILSVTATIWLTSVGNGAAPSDGAPSLVPMLPIVVPIVGSGRLDGALRVKLVLAATDAAAAARLTQRLPELRAASVAGAIEFSRLYASSRTPVNAVQLRSALTAALHAEDAGVSDTLIVEVSAVS